MTPKPSEQRLEAARQAVWQMLSIAEVLGSQIDEAVIRRAAPGPISAAACRLASLLASGTIGQIEVISLLLAGGYPEEAIADIEAEVNRRPAARPRARARRPRPAATPLVITPDMTPVSRPDLAVLEPPAAAVEPPSATVAPPTGGGPSR